MTNYDKQRMALLTGDLDYRIQFAKPKTVQQADAIEVYQNLNERQRTELLTDMFLFWHTFHSQLAMGIE